MSNVPVQCPNHQSIALPYLPEAFRKFNDRSPWIRDDCCLDVVHLRHSAARLRELDSFGFKFFAERLKPFDLEPNVIDGAPGSPSLILCGFPSEEVQHVPDSGQVGSDEVIRLTWTKSRVQRLHVPLLHFHKLFVGEMNVVMRDWRRVRIACGDEFHFYPVRANKISEHSVVSCRGRSNRLPGAGLAPDGQLVAVGNSSGSGNGNAGNRESEMIQRRSPCRPGGSLL